jgi:DNA-directed RNA polymerase subunit beta
MARVVPIYRRYRKNFSKIKEVLEISNLIEVQKRSYEQFLQANVDPDKREPIGLQAVFKTVFPIKDFYETASLEFVNYRLTEPKYDVEECLLRGMTYAAPIKVTVRLVVWDINEETKAKSIKAVKEQEVYFGEIPLMTDNGTFIVNGTERVIVSQLHRSPGVFFDQDQIKPHGGGKVFYYARIIPYRGSWIDFEFDQKDLCSDRPASEDSCHGPSSCSQVHGRRTFGLFLPSREGSHQEREIPKGDLERGAGGTEGNLRYFGS